MSKKQEKCYKFDEELLISYTKDSDDEIKDLINNKENIDPNTFNYCPYFKDYYEFRLNAGLSRESLLLGDNIEHHGKILNPII